MTGLMTTQPQVYHKHQPLMTVIPH